MQAIVTPEVLYGVGAVILLAALVWGWANNKNRNRANDSVTEAATRAEYDHPETYAEDRRELERKIRPS
jgi:hypothetical protein